MNLFWRKPATPVEPERTPPLSREWIAIADRMPETSHQQILLWNGRFPRLGLCLGGGVKNPQAKCFYTHYGDQLHDVTHWCPIPEYPI